MKRLLCNSLILIVILGMLASVAAQAATPSASNPGRPDISGGSTTIVIYPFFDRDEMDEDKKEEFEDAKDNLNPDDLHDKLEEDKDETPATDEAQTPAVQPQNPEKPTQDALPPIPDHVTVTDFFYIDGDTAPGTELTVETGLGGDDYVALFHYVNGEWKKVDITDNGDGTISFIYDDIGPYAIVSNMEDGESNAVLSPQTGVNANMPIAVMLFAAVAVLVLRKYAQA